jgi:pimeloyl-ACP methyl ester carboxylesterase
MNIERKTCRADDSVKIVYSVSGHGEPALLFIHGGLADRTFWDGQHQAFAKRHRVIAPDLAGHGDSGTNRTKWGIPEFGADVRAVVDREKPERVVLIGNSMGGPVAIEAALLLPGRAAAVIGVDTFQSLEYRIKPEEARQRAEHFRADYAGGLRAMVDALFHRDADPAIRADSERRMARTSPETAYHMFLCFAGYDVAAAARRMQVPLRAVNGDIYPTDFEAIRRIRPDFDAFIMAHMGHYPMLEQPEEFNRLLARMIAGIQI